MTTTQTTIDPKVTQMTAAQLLDMPDDGYRHELVRGELKTMSPAGNVHGAVANVLAWSLTNYVMANDLGIVYAAETGFLLESAPDTVRAPDAAFTSWARIDEVGEVEGFWPGAPDLAVEVVSPNDRCSEVNEKVAEWLSAGARMVVVVDYRRREVAVHRSHSDRVVLTEGDVLEGGDVVPGWVMPVSKLFVARVSKSKKAESV